MLCIGKPSTRKKKKTAEAAQDDSLSDEDKQDPRHGPVDSHAKEVSEDDSMEEEEEIMVLRVMRQQPETLRKRVALRAR